MVVGACDDVSRYPVNPVMADVGPNARGTRMEWLLIMVVLAAIALNAIATIAVLRGDIVSRGRIAAQLVIVWFLPIVGACLLLVYLYSLSGRHDDVDRTAFVDTLAGDDGKGKMPPGANPCGCAAAGAVGEAVD
jgi:hypothetical protein